MQSITIPIANLLYLFFFVVPGFLTFRLITFFGKLSFDFDQFDKTAISVSISGLTLLAPYFFYLEPKIETIEAATLGQLEITFALDVLSACVLGILIGVGYDTFIRPEQVYRPQLEDSPTLHLEGARVINGAGGIEDQGEVYIAGVDISQIWFQKVPDEEFFEQSE